MLGSHIYKSKHIPEQLAEEVPSHRPQCRCKMHTFFYFDGKLVTDCLPIRGAAVSQQQLPAAVETPTQRHGPRTTGGETDKRT